MPPPRYQRCSSIEELLATLQAQGDRAKILAGGQSLIPIISLGLAEPEVLLDINRLPGLDCCGVEGGVARIGALVRHVTLERLPQAFAAMLPVLPMAAQLIGHAAIRNRGTLVGSLAHADPAAEWPAVALALDAQLVLKSARTERTLAAREFFLGPLTAALEPHELLYEARLPIAPARTGASVLELTYRHGDYAVVGVVAQLTLDVDATMIRDARVALFGVGPTPLRCAASERLLQGADAAGFGDAAVAAQRVAEPVDDATASGDYRREMVGVFVRRALQQAYARAQAATVPDQR
jgi:carbon-monoxide dehydrogenase medium subunit